MKQKLTLTVERSAVQAARRTARITRRGARHATGTPGCAADTAQRDGLGSPPGARWMNATP